MRREAGGAAAERVDKRSRGANQVWIEGNSNEQPHGLSIRLTRSSAACDA